MNDRPKKVVVEEPIVLRPVRKRRFKVTAVATVRKGKH